MAEQPTRVQGRVRISWDGTTLFNGVYDDVTADTAAVPGVEIEGGRDSAQTLSPPKVSAGSFELFNDDGKYSQHNAASPVYQRVIPARPVSYLLTHGTADAYDSPTPYDEEDYYDAAFSYPAGSHLIDEITQTTEWGNRRVGIRTLGREVVLTDSVISIPLFTDLRTDECVTKILDAVGWPVNDRVIGFGDTVLRYWWVDARSPWDALVEILGAEGPGTFYVDREGLFHYENRNYRATAPRSTVSQATFRDHLDATGLWFARMSYEPGYHAIYNRARYSTVRRAPQALGTVWEYGATLSLGANETTVLTARPSDPFVNAVSPVAGTDFTVTAGSATVTLLSTGGVVADIQVTAGASGATITGVSGVTAGLRLRAQALTVVSETVVVNSVDASASIAKYSPIPGANIPVTLDVAGWPEIDPAAAVAVCNAWISRYMEARPLVTITLHNGTADLTREILNRLPSDRVTIVEANTGLDHDVWINAKDLHIGQNGALDATFGCELCDLLVGVVWDGANTKWDQPNTVWGT